VSGSGEPGFMPSRGNARRPLDSSPPDRLSTGSPQKEPRERRSPFIPAPYVNVARRSRDGARVARLRKGPARRTAVEGTCAGMRAGAARRGLESAWVRPRIVVEVASSPPVPSALSGCARKSVLEHPDGNSKEEPTSRRRRLGSRSPVRFHDVRKRNDLGRTRSFSRAKSRREAKGSATGASAVERERSGARDENARLPRPRAPKARTAS
jgi:hypothetical protein